MILDVNPVRADTHLGITQGKMYNSTQLQFNLDIPMNAENMSIQYTSPRAIIFERIMSAKNPRLRAAGSPVKISTLSSQKLSEAMQLAKRDIKAARCKKALQSVVYEQQLDQSVMKVDTRTKSQKSKTATVFLPAQTKTAVPQKEPKRAAMGGINKTGAKPLKDSEPAHGREERDIYRLRLEMEQIILHLEKKLRDKDISLQEKLLLLDQDEEQRVVIHHLEQMRKSSRTVYTLQQQVQVIREELKRQSHAKNQSSNKEKILHRLAATYRGSIRQLQIFCLQLPEHLVLNDNFVAIAALYREVSRLIRELLLCSLQIGHTDYEEVQNLLGILKEMEPKDTPSRRVEKGDTVPSCLSGTRLTRNLELLRSPKKQPRTPPKLKPKIPVIVKKKPACLKLPGSRGSSPERRLVETTLPDGYAQRVPADLCDRPEWIPPSNSPYKDVGPPPLAPLLESPVPMHPKTRRPRLSPAAKQVTFCSTPELKSTEHDIDSLPCRHPDTLKDLKTKLARGSEDEVRYTIQPLPKKKVGELAQSSKNIGHDKAASHSAGTAMNDVLENQIQDIIDETRKEMQKFQAEQDAEEEAVLLHQSPSVETLLHRLDAIEREEEAIRHHWRQIYYGDTRCHDTRHSKEATVSPPEMPASFAYTKERCHALKKSKKEFIKFVRIGSPSQVKESAPFTGRVLTIASSTVKTINKNKSEYENYLRYTFHAVKGKFDPWKLVEDLSDDILKEVVASISGEVSGMCEEYANEMFQREFADAPNSSES